MQKTRWKLTYLDKFDGIGGAALKNTARPWREVDVPCTVQASPFGMNLHTLYKGDNVEKIGWMGEQYWVFKTALIQPEIEPEQEAVYAFLGIDYSYEIYLDGEKVWDSEGMFSVVEIPLTRPGVLSELIVIIRPFCDSFTQPEGLKARLCAGNGWDFSPRIKTAGIWDEAGIVIRDKLRIESVYIKTTLANSQRAEVTVYIALSKAITAACAVVELSGVRQSLPVMDTDRIAACIIVPSPTLWWPNGMGEPYLTELSIHVHTESGVVFTHSQRVGLREINKIPCDGQGAEDTPHQLVINGRKMFIKGFNWVPPDVCIGEITAEKYRVLLTQFKDSNVNFVRVWGGGLKEKASFYELCDELGLLVMQEFPFACQTLSRSDKFLRLTVREVSAIIKRLRQYTCIALWSGGNEHYHYWDAVDSGSEIMEKARSFVLDTFHLDDSRPDCSWLAGADRYNEPCLSLMGHLCQLLDGTRPYQVTSAMEGEGELHGIWNWNPQIGDHRYRDYKDLYSFWNSTDQHLYSEASVSSIANIETIKYVLNTSAPTLPNTKHEIWRLHNAFHSAWDALPDLWLDIPSHAALFDPADGTEDIQDFVLTNQWMQAEGGRYLIEAIRRKTGRTSGVIWWGANEPWPCLAGNALIDYFGMPKASLSTIKNSFEPVILSLRYEHCVAASVKPTLHITNDGCVAIDGTYEIELVGIHSSIRQLISGNISCEPYSSAYVLTLPRIRLDANTGLHVTCRLFSEDKQSILHQNQYFFASSRSECPFGGAVGQYLRKQIKTLCS